MDQNEASVGLNHLTNLLAYRIVGRNGRADSDPAVLCNFGSHVADASNVDVAMFFRESKFRRKMLTDQIAVQNGDRPAANFQEFCQQHIRDCGLSRSGESREEDGDTLLVPWWKAAAQFANNFWICEPRWNVASFIQPVTQIGAREVQHARSLWNFVIWNVAILTFQIHHHAERHHGDADFPFVLLEKFLGLVGTIERLAVSVLARTGVIATHNEVRDSVVLADECVPNGFARSAHTHGQRQQ